MVFFRLYLSITLRSFGLLQVSEASSLRHLNVGGTFITDESLFAIANSCPHLKARFYSCIIHHLLFYFSIEFQECLSARCLLRWLNNDIKETWEVNQNLIKQLDNVFKICLVGLNHFIVTFEGALILVLNFMDAFWLNICQDSS